MFDLSAWREALHIGEWSGLAIGAAVGLGALAWYVAPLRKIAIVGAIAASCFYGGELHGDLVGTADKQKEWDEAKATAAAAQKKRDADIGQELEAKYQPKLADLQQQSDERKKKADAYERKISNLLKKNPAAARCELGAAAVRMRAGHQAGGV